MREYTNLDQVYEKIKEMDEVCIKGYCIEDRIEQRLIRIEMYLRWLVDSQTGPPPRE